MIVNKDDYSKIPAQGYLIAYMVEGALYASYEVHDNNIIIDSQYENILDKSYVCHFFDEDTEYRMITREARDDVIRLLITHEQEMDMNEDLLFSEDVLVSPSYLIASNLPDKIRIVNRYKYSDNDTLVLDNYRIASPTNVLEQEQSQ